ncbi:hypothetical protein, partial [Rosenbergiella collisarenosi]|uniref:hypothetical protein n=1 Tax=Rosenbergiella collisarenosi TaxID=1544695 RepID=UPI001F4F9103
VAYITRFTSGVNHYFDFFSWTKSLQSLSPRCVSCFAVSVVAHYREFQKRRNTFFTKIILTAAFHSKSRGYTLLSTDLLTKP